MTDKDFEILQNTILNMLKCFLVPQSYYPYCYIFSIHVLKLTMADSDISESISRVTRSSQSNSRVTAGLWLAKIQKTKNLGKLKFKSKSKCTTYFTLEKDLRTSFPWTCGILEFTKHGITITEQSINTFWGKSWRYTSDKEPACQCRRQKRRGLHPWFGTISWRRQQQPIPVFLPGESHGQRSLVGSSSWGSQSRTRLSTHTIAVGFKNTGIDVTQTWFKNWA